MNIYLIRHGATQANEEHRYCGSTDLPLSEGGRKALRALHYEICPQYFVTSGRRRADETLQILFGDVPYCPDSRFREVDFGAFEMKTYEELKGDPAYQAWITGDNEANIPPGGESGTQMTCRGLEGFQELPDGTAVITHGGVIAAIMAHLFPEAGRHRYQRQPSNGRGYALYPGGFREIP